MRFLVLVLPEQPMIIEVKIVKMTLEAVSVEGVATVDDSVVMPAS